MHAKINCVLKRSHASANHRQPAVAEGSSPKHPTGKRAPIKQAGRCQWDLAVASQIMASVAACRSLALVLVVVSIFVTGAAAGSNKSLNITNHCSYTVWPGILSGPTASSAAVALDNTGFELLPWESRAMPVPSGWFGHVWGRTLCSTDAGTGKFTCVTGDCGSGKLDCAGGNGKPTPPATLVQFTFDGSGGMDWYGVSLVDGFNLPVLMAPQGTCAQAGCVVDLNAACPAELRVTSGSGATVACKSACVAFQSPQYCCTGDGEYGNHDTCKPSAYSELFKKACPRASSYAYDGAGSTFRCDGGDATGTYAITFCPTRTSGKHSTNPMSQAPETAATANLQPLVNGGSTTPYTGGGRQAGGTASGPWRVTLAVAILGVVTTVLGLVANWLGLFKAICSR